MDEPAPAFYAAVLSKDLKVNLPHATNTAQIAALPPGELQSRIARILVYPIKSCAGVDLKEAVLTSTGLDYDRAWMVVDEQGEFVSQRELPRMALVQPKFRLSDLVLRAPGMLPLHLLLDSAEQPCKVRVWNDQVDAYDMGDLAAQWFSDFLLADKNQGAARPGKLRLARFDPEHRRASNTKWTGDVLAQTQFADAYALLLTSMAAHEDLNQRLRAAGKEPVGVERFRPNIVLEGLAAHDEDRIGDLSVATDQGMAIMRPVKPCVRCSIPNVDPASGVADPTVSDLLQSYRQDPKMDGAITFGMNAIVIQGDEYVLRVGQAAGADYKLG